MSQAGLVDFEAANPQIPTLFTADTGTAVPLVNDIVFAGGFGLSTSAAGKTVTIALSTPLQPINSILTDSGGVSVKADVTGQLRLQGGSGMSVTGVGPSNVATVSGNNATALTLGVASFDPAGFVVTNGHVTLNSAGVGLTITGSTGLSISPVLGNWNIIGNVGITTAGAGNTLNISAVTGGYTWTSIIASAVTMVAQHGYISVSGTLSSATLPSTAAVGDTYKISSIGTGLFKIVQNAGQLLVQGSQVSTTGVTGSFTSITQYSNIEIRCVVANTTFAVISSDSFTVV